jgi:prevent-host-death family protein
MRTWLVKDARAHFSDVIDGALRGEPQRVARRGKGAVVVVSETDWKKATEGDPQLDFGEFLASFPLTPEEWAEVAPKRHQPRPNPFLDEE